MDERKLPDFKSFRLGDIDVEPQRNLIRNGDVSFALEPRIMDVLCVLAEHAREVVARDTLIDEIWHIEYGGEDSLTRAVSILRKTFREAGAMSEIIETIPKRGYRLRVPIIQTEPSSELASPVSDEVHQHLTDADMIASASSSGKPGRLWTKPSFLVAVAIGLGSLLFVLWPRAGAPTEIIEVSTMVAAPEYSLAVLPFADLSAAGDQEYFADGISEEILNVMTELPGLHVAGRTSSFSFRNQEIDLREIGKTLHVAYVLEGSVRKQDDRIRIRVRLIDAEDGYHIWAETYDRSLEDVFVIQDEIARAVARELDLVLDVSANATLAKTLTTSEIAHDLVLRARAAYRKTPDAETFEYSEKLLQQAVTIDPNYADAWIAIATLNNFASGYLIARSPQAGFETSRHAIAQAREIDPEGIRTIIWAANIRYFEGDLVGAYQLAQKAIALKPENEGIVFSIGHYNAIFGYTQRAVPYLERATQLDPLDGFAWNSRALVSQNLGKSDRTEIEASRAIELGDWGALDTLTWNAVGKGNLGLAYEHHIDLFEFLEEQFDGPGARLVWISIGRAVFEGHEADGLMIREMLETQFAAEDFEPGSLSINLTAKLGMYDEFYKQWRPSYATKSTLAIALWSDFDWARNIRQHEGFTAFAEREGFVALWQTYGWPDICGPDPGTDGSDGRFSCS